MAAVVVIAPDHFSIDGSVTPGPDDPHTRRIISLMEHFNLMRVRNAQMTGRASRFAKDVGSLGKVQRYLNKLDRENYVVVSHVIFRLLVDDSSVSADEVFDHIMSNAFGYASNSHLYARVCADLSRMYPGLAGHIARRIDDAHADLRANSRREVPQRNP